MNKNTHHKKPEKCTPIKWTTYPYTRTLNKTGRNSLCMTIPYQFVKHLKLKGGRKVKVTYRNNVLEIHI